jgi:hypothetical protein
MTAGQYQRGCSASGEVSSVHVLAFNESVSPAGQAGRRFQDTVINIRICKSLSDILVSGSDDSNRKKNSSVGDRHGLAFELIPREGISLTKQHR